MFGKINIVIVLLLATSAIFGQNSNTRFGIFFDPVVTWLRSDVSDVTRDKAHLGFDLGMSADIYFAKNYAFATGISLLNTGGTLKYSNDITLRTKDGNVPLHPGTGVSYKIQYIKLPIAFKFKTHMIGRITYSANMGFDPMVRVSTRADFNDLKNVKATRETKLLNLGWHFGVGAQYSLGGEAALFGGLSFMNTFMDITKPQHDRITSNNLVFRIGVMF